MFRVRDDVRSKENPLSLLKGSLHGLMFPFLGPHRFERQLIYLTDYDLEILNEHIF